ncbi:MAG: hypothetical protein ACT4QE_06205 [Anaerolineales bacterium]
MTNQNSWVEQLYQHAEYYYWVPNALGKQSIPGQRGYAKLEKIRRKMRSTEVPLNTVFNVLLRLLPDRLLSNLLVRFTADNGMDLGKNFELVDTSSWEIDLGNFVQPDVTLESDAARVFIELKVEDHFSIQQAQKYIFLHALWVIASGKQKQPCLLFLSPKSLHSQWQPSERSMAFAAERNAADLLKFLKSTDLPTTLGNKPSTVYLHEHASRILDTLILGSATWRTVGHCLYGEMQNLTGNALSDSHETVAKLIQDFLVELKSRKLWSEESGMS